MIPRPPTCQGCVQNAVVYFTLVAGGKAETYACCQGCPCESSRCTVFGCGQVRYDYACGYSVVVRFQKHGDILVTYHGF